MRLFAGFLMLSGLVCVASSSSMAGENTFLVIEERSGPAAPLRPQEEQPGVIMEWQRQTFSRSGEVSSTEVNAQIRDILRSFAALFDDLEGELGVVLDDVTLSLQISAEGRVGLLGTGASAGSTAGVVVTLRHRDFVEGQGP
ncbi:hypothetical protein J2T57_004428 [Natronocella acetinitrilica]|uniref:Pepco domain-containing protein n=1 Tax=Natronocella acetinitrilica TaxID=414046 RepID=A0AAE3G918_9GAMM|nr:hypothetical protein [Natronocella acetinitrilica]MCP1677249.1 hypothetical protein [Natronocella acetinitrilica]